jgi:hypothetical protein
MLKLLRGTDVTDAIAAHLHSNAVFRLAVAFWGAGAVKSLGLDRLPKGRPLAQRPMVICNLESGCCHPKELKLLLPRV